MNPTPAPISAASAAAPAPWHLVALFLLVVVGGGLRLWNLGAWSMDGDEVETLNESIRLFRAEELHKTRAVLIAGPLVQVCCKALLSAGLPAEWALRLVPFLTSLLALAVVAWGTTRLYGSRAGLAALLLLVLCPLHFHASSFGRYLAPVYLCGAAGGLTLLWFLRTGRLRDLLQALLWCLLGVGFHATFALTAGTLLVAAVLAAGPRRRAVLGITALVVTAGLVLLWVSGGVEVAGLDREVSARSGSLRLRSTLWMVGSLVHDVGAGVLLMAAVGWFLARREHPREMRLVGSAFLLSLGVLLVLGRWMPIGPRYFLGMVPWLPVLAGVGLDHALRSTRSRVAAAALTGLILAPSLPVFLSQLVDNSRYDVASLATQMEQVVKPGDRVLAESHDVVEYYTGLPCEELPTRASVLRERLHEGGTAYLVLLLQRGQVIGTEDHEVQRYIEQNSTLLQQVMQTRLDAHRFETRLYRWDPPGSSGDRP